VEGRVRNVGLFDPERRSKDILGAINTETAIDVNRHIEFYEGCCSRKDDPYLPTYRLVLEKLKAKLREIKDGVSKL
jgi:hypothetical protein